MAKLSNLFRHGSKICSDTKPPLIEAKVHKAGEWAILASH